MCFTNDLMFFFKAEEKSIFLLRNFFKPFQLKANVRKSNIFFSDQTNSLRGCIASKLGFKVSVLLIKYLGMPLITSKLKIKGCKPPLDKILSKINSWRSKFLSYMGRILLIKSILAFLSSPLAFINVWKGSLELSFGLVHRESKLKQRWLRRIFAFLERKRAST